MSQIPEDSSVVINSNFTLQDASEEYSNYIKELVAQCKSNNAKALCLKCWCLLSASQKTKHMPEHLTPSNILTPRQFSSELSFRTFAIQNGRSKNIDGEIYFQVISKFPEPHTQTKQKNIRGRETISVLPNDIGSEAVSWHLTKQMKMTSTDAILQEEPIHITLSQKNLMNTSREKTHTNEEAKVSKRKENFQKVRKNY